MMGAVEGALSRAQRGRHAGVIRVLLGSCLAFAVAVLVARVPRLPANADLYLHLVWTHQVMRCLDQAAVPVWLPDLNGGTGSPGLRLHSPLGPVVEGVLGLVLGDAGSGLRAAAVLAAALLLALTWRRRGTPGFTVWGILMLSPVVVFSLLGRSAWSEFVALPLTWWLLEAAITRTLVPWREGPILALLWLLHGPSSVMVVLIVAAAAGLSGEAKLVAKGAGAVAVAAGLSAWHWLPLADEMAMLDNRGALTEGIFRADRNFLGSPQAHSVDATIFLSWCAVGLLLAALLGRWWRAGMARVAVVATCALLASPLAAWLWRLHSPLAFLQFPWRWLFPAALAAAVPVCEALRSWAGRLGFAVMLVPLLVFPLPEMARDPGLTAAMGWQEAGVAVNRAIAGNPFLVDAPQHRPRSWSLLASNLLRFKQRLVLLVPDVGSWRVERWTPLERVVSVDVPMPALVELRLLDYPTWRVSVDGIPAPVASRTGVVGTAVPAGRHTVRASWGGNPLAKVGLAVAVATAAVVLVCVRRQGAP